MRANIIQDVLDAVNHENTGELVVSYGATQVEQGNKLAPSQVRSLRAIQHVTRPLLCMRIDPVGVSGRTPVPTEAFAGWHM